MTFFMERPCYNQPTETRESTIEQEAVARVVMSNTSLKRLHTLLGEVLSEYEAVTKIEKE